MFFLFIVKVKVLGYSIESVTVKILAPRRACVLIFECGI